MKPLLWLLHCSIRSEDRRVASSQTLLRMNNPVPSSSSCRARITHAINRICKAIQRYTSSNPVLSSKVHVASKNWSKCPCQMTVAAHDLAAAEAKLGSSLSVFTDLGRDLILSSYTYRVVPLAIVYSGFAHEGHFCEMRSLFPSPPASQANCATGVA